MVPFGRRSQLAEILLERGAGVATIILNAPERCNALGPSMVRELLSACDEVDRDETIGAVVMRAAGDCFCAGAHRALLAEVRRDPARTEAFRDLGLIYRAFVRVGELLPPVVAAVRGIAIGAGVNLMFAADLRIVAETARIVPGFSRIGIHPGGGHFALLGRTGSREAVAAIGVFGEAIDGRRAAELGLAWEAVPEAEVERRAHEIAARTALDPELARATVRSMRLELGPPAVPWASALEAERAWQMWSLRRDADAEPERRFE